MNFSLSEIDSSWLEVFVEYETLINTILDAVKDEAIAPNRLKIFRAFQRPLNEIRVVIIGQDPYPGEGVADGLAFSTPPGNPVPASLRNIYIEYQDDLKLPLPTTTELSNWAEEGVLLLNRTLTTTIGERNAHLDHGWMELTYSIAKRLGELDVIAILWGKQAQQLAPLFHHAIISPHPSPLSAYRGFFGSKPFSKANAILLKNGKQPINWQLP